MGRKPLTRRQKILFWIADCLETWVLPLTSVVGWFFGIGVVVGLAVGAASAGYHAAFQLITRLMN